MYLLYSCGKSPVPTPRRKLFLIIDKEFNAQEKVEDVSKNLINIGGRIGNLMDVTQNALDPDGPDGIEISKKEKDNIYKAITEVEEKIARLKLAIK